VPPKKGQAALKIEQNGNGTWDVKDAGGNVVASTGDIDNFSKTAQDALIGIAFIDDAQICRLVSEKRYGTPALEIEITPAGIEDEA
jgi:Holliday junction resolvase RusA-like endonuclease